jgi:hypothetical protein
MSQNISNASFLNNENFQKPTPFHSSQINNTSLSILNKISAISIKNLSKSNSFDINDFSFLQDPKQNPHPHPQIIDESLRSKANIENLAAKSEREILDKLPIFPKNEGFPEDEANIKRCVPMKSQEEVKNEGNAGFPFSNKKPPTMKLGDKSMISNSSENFDFLVKDWGEYFHDEEPAKLKVFFHHIIHY